MYTMKDACEKTGLAYETLKFYCNQGLVPNVKRDSRNRRIFDDRDIAWINSLNCLKNCSMGIAEMKEYISLCMEGEESIPERKKFWKPNAGSWRRRKSALTTPLPTSTGSRASMRTCFPERQHISAI